MRLFLFGEDTANLHPIFRQQLIDARADPQQQQLFQQIAHALRHEISSLPAVERHRIPPFSNMDELNDRSGGGPTHAGIENALMFTSSISKYIRQSTKLHQQTGPDVMVGLSVGSLAAATVALSPYASTLIPLAAEIGLIAFRLGLHVSRTAQQLECVQKDDNTGPWSRIVVRLRGTEAQEILDSFKADTQLSVTCVPYICGSGSNFAVIGGRQTSMLQLKAFARFQSTSSSEQQSYQPYHAAHLHANHEATSLLKTLKPEVLRLLDTHQHGYPLVTSTITSGSHDQTSLRTIFENVIQEIIQVQWTISGLVEGISHIFEEQYPSAHQLTECGASQWTHELLAGVRESSKIELDANNLGSQSSLFGKSPGTTKRPQLAIVGMAGRFPDAADHEKFWTLLEAGLDVHREVPNDRFDIKKYYDPGNKVRNTSHTPFGCWIEQPGLFDPRFFNMSPREATQTDPMHRLGLVTAYEALEMAGYVPNRTPSTRLDRIGTFYGQTSDDWREINAAQDVDTYFITGGVRAFAPGRINYYFKFTGPSFNIDTACSSSAAAIQLACTSLWAGDCDTAVAGGLNIMTNSDIFSGLSRGQFLSKTGNCQTYDNDADGYCRGDGIGSIVIKRLEDAQADNDRILSVISGIATNHSSNAISITHPHAPTQEELFTRVMNDAGLDPHDVDYVEMHGTGTQAGDSTEMESVTNIFAPPSRAGTRKTRVHIGSVKANVGHGEAVSGVTAMIKVIQMMQKSTIPPHCGIKGHQNEDFPKDLEFRNVHIALKPTPFPVPEDRPRRIFVNNFSAAGGNTAMLLEDAPRSRITKEDTRGHWVVAVSAKSKAALSNNTEILLQYLKQRPEVHLPDLSYTTTARRIQHNYRMAFSCDTVAKVIEHLASNVDASTEPVSNVKPSVAFAYTGQGSHYNAIGNQLFMLSSTFRSDVITFDRLGTTFGYPSFLSLVDGSMNAQELTPLALQLGLTSIQMALTRWWASMGLKPNVVIGHSLGEYAALNAAGVISVSDTIYLVGERAKLLQEKCIPGTHAMLAVKSSVNMLENALFDIREVEFACVNGPGETVMAGPLKDIDALATKLGLEGVKCTKLNTPFAFHSSQVDTILETFEGTAQHVHFNKPQIPIISPLLANVLSEEGSITPTYLSSHARNPVNFKAALLSAQESGHISETSVWVELGPHPVCSGFIKSHFGTSIVIAPTFRKDVSPYNTISESLSRLHLAGLDLDWNEYHRDFTGSLQMLDLPAYAFDNKNYWIQYSGDWNLRKGELAAGDSMPGPEISKLSTTSVQRIVSEEVDKSTATVIIESDISNPQLLTAISGHMVNGTALCPSSLYADMALTLGNYIHTLLLPSQNSPPVNVSNMEVSKPFIANDNGGKGQTLRLTGTADAEGNGGTLLFSSGSGKTQIQHAKCLFSYGSQVDWLARWQRQSYLISERIRQLEEAASSGHAHRMLRGMAYKLFGAFVEYDQRYRGMEEVILDSPQREATAKISFQTTEADGSFFCSPYWIDSVCHLAGFIVNANDTIDSSKQVYVSHGWESMRFAEPLEKDKTYRSYVKMQPMPENVMAGDVYILDGHRIVGLCETLKFQCIPRSLLNTFLPPKSAKATAASAPGKAVKAQPTKAPIRARPRPNVVESRTSVIDKVLEIIAEEVGVPLNELTDPVEFAALGVDSLMSLAISSRVREEMDIDCQSSIFADYPSIGAVRVFLKAFGDVRTSQSEMKDRDSTSSPSVYSDANSSSTGSASTQLTPPDTPRELNESEVSSSILRQIISEAMEVDIAELISIEDLSSAGMDSLMALTLLSDLREKAALALPTDFFTENRSIKAMETALHISQVPPASKVKKEPTPAEKPEPKYAPSPAVSVTPQKSSTSPATQKSLSTHTATSILLQGSPKTISSPQKQFWLIPDGGGAPTSYNFPTTISPSLKIWGLISPFLKTPEAFIVGVTGIATLYIKEIRRRQPKGPYHLGGWSAGGVISYEIAQQLITSGDNVETLALIDTPPPSIIEPLPGSLHRFFASIGLLGDGDGVLEKLPPWLLPHFAASVHALSTYDAKALPKEHMPNVSIMWCEDGVCKEPGDPRPDPYPYGHAQWLLENRTDFGPQEWGELLRVDGMGKVRCEHMEGNHFSMMRTPRVERVVEFLRRALGVEA